MVDATPAEVAGEPAAGILLRAYRTMRTIRAFEDRVHEQKPGDVREVIAGHLTDA